MFRPARILKNKQKKLYSHGRPSSYPNQSIGPENDALSSPEKSMATPVAGQEIKNPSRHSRDPSASAASDKLALPIAL
ncbi:hypothetical protein K0M31_015484 [Melipona bicolor]|uniref:Uncharacterized protein n=1 Tax=Melipona bicolor TaxID=60889 RepID=A0AA40KF43_9HYME|nr:hypothetical protein K0M31_015484 [Melipona bicolor]